MKERQEWYVVYGERDDDNAFFNAVIAALDTLEEAKKRFEELKRDPSISYACLWRQWIETGTELIEEYSRSKVEGLGSGGSGGKSG